MTPRGRLLAGALALALVLGAVLTWALLGWARAAERADHATTAAAQADARAARQAAHAASVVRAQAGEQLRRVEEERDSARAEVAALRARADSTARRRAALPAPGPTASDSARYWRAEAELAAEEISALRAGLAAAEQRAEREAEVAALWRARAEVAEPRADSLADALERLRDELARVAATTTPRCTVPGTFGRIPCPSRTTAAVAGAVVALALTHGR